MEPIPGEIDVVAVFALVNERREAEQLSVGQLSRRVKWISPKALERMLAQTHGAFVGDQFVMPFIQWVGRTPESFTVGADQFPGELLPEPGEAGWRWYWDMPALATELDARRIERELTWAEVAEEFGTSLPEIKSLQKSKYGMSISFSMRAARWLERTATSFLWESDGRGLPWSGRRV